MQKQGIIVTSGPGGATSGAVALCDIAFRSKLFLEGTDADALRALGYESVTVDGATFDRIPGAQQWTEIPS